ncbi:MAG: alpha/beta hydrolase [Pseudomonadota bacterium]
MGPAVAIPPGGKAWDRGFTATTRDGVSLRCAAWTGGSKGLVLLLSGRTEFLEKMSVPAAGLVARGYDVVSLDWRGQGLSDRLLDPPIMGHVHEFADYHLDIEALLTAPEIGDLGPAKIMLAHSMGGAIGLGAIHRMVFRPELVIFSAPMLGVKMSAIMRFASKLVIWVAGLLGRMDRQPPLGNAKTPYVFEGFEGNVLTHDRAVFDWMVSALKDRPRLQLGMPSIRWFDAAFREMDWLEAQTPPKIPSLFLRGGEEGVVDTGAIARAAEAFGADLVVVPGARHEVLIETAEMRDAAWQAIDDFLDAQSVASA